MSLRLCGKNLASLVPCWLPPLSLFSISAFQLFSFSAFSTKLFLPAGVSLGSSYIRIMNWPRHFILGLIAASGLYGSSLLAAAAPLANPYTPIVTRNVFGLVPIPTNPPPVDPATLVPPPKITPNGIMTLFGKLQVLFKVAGVAKPGQPPKEESYMMSEGDRQNEIEVQKIDEPSATITFINHGVVQELGLVAGGISVGAPGAGGVPPPGMPTPAMAPNGGMPVGFGGRFGRNRNVNSGGNNPSPDGGAGNGAAAAPTAAAAEPPITPEAQVIMMEANRMLTQDAVNSGDMVPLPPTEMTPPEATGIGGAPLVAPAPAGPEGAGGGNGTAPGGP